MKISDEITTIETRDELDSHIRTRFGEDNKTVEIELSEEEAKKMFLSEKSKVFGARIKVVKAVAVDKEVI